MVLGLALGFGFVSGLALESRVEVGVREDMDGSVRMRGLGQED
jgi:hypothetical protein